MKMSVFAVASLLVCLGLAAPGANAQASCRTSTFSGTYAFYDEGSSAVFSSAAVPSAPFHWAGLYAPFATVGEVTIKADGTGHGFYWMRIGSFNGGSNTFELNLTVTEMNADCTGKYTYQVNLPGATEPTTIVERFVLLNNGREFRSVPISIENGIDYLTWIGEGRRISEPGMPVNTCGPQTALGSYVATVQNFVQFSPDVPIFSDVVLLRFNVSRTGAYTGTLYEKLGPTGNLEFPISGTVSVSPDCSYAMNIDLTIQGTPVTIDTRGVFFSQGQGLYGLATSPGVAFSFAQGERITPYAVSNPE